MSCKNFFRVEGQNLLRGRGLNCSRGVEKIYRAEEFVKFFLDDVKGVTVAKIVDASKVGRNFKSRRVEGHVGHVADNLRELLTQNRVGGMCLQSRADFFRLDLGGVRQNIFQRAVVFYQRRGGLCTDTLDAGDIVGGVAAQALEVDQKRRREAVFVGKSLLVVNFDARLFGEQHTRRRINQL